MCGGQDHDRPGPSTLNWGRAAVFSGTLALVAWGLLWSNLPIPFWVERILRLGGGPLVALAGWSLTNFLRTEIDDVLARFAGIAHIVVGALLGMAMPEGGVGEEGFALLAVSWWCAGVMALGGTALRHPLFGKAFGSVGVAVGLLTVVWSGFSLPEATDVRGLPDPITLLSVWYIAMLFRTFGAVRRLSRGYAGWTRPAFT